MKLSTFSPVTLNLKSDSSVSITYTPLTAAQRLDILSSVQNSERYGSAMLSALEYTVTNWTGIVDDNGVAISFDKFKLKFLPSEILIEVSNAILGASQLGDDEKKV